MAGHGGHMPATEDSAWERLTSGIAEDLGDPSVRYLLAQSGGGEIAGVAGCRLVTLGGAFAPKKTLHISVMYVRPAVQAPRHRRRADDKNARVGSLVRCGGMRLERLAAVDALSDVLRVVSHAALG